VAIKELAFARELRAASEEEYEEQKKASEAEFQPFFMKLYATDGDTSGTKDATSEDVPSGPRVEEVD
jgi:hypothetical protein